MGTRAAAAGRPAARPPTFRTASRDFVLDVKGLHPNCQWQAAALQASQAKYLDSVRTKATVVDLDFLLRRSKTNHLQHLAQAAAKAGKPLSYNEQLRLEDRPVGLEDILDMLHAHFDGQLTVTALELNRTLQNVLQAKGYEVQFADFLQHSGHYDRIVMNPPFENGSDTQMLPVSSKQRTHWTISFSMRARYSSSGSESACLPYP